MLQARMMFIGLSILADDPFQHCIFEAIPTVKGCSGRPYKKGVKKNDSRSAIKRKTGGADD